MDAPGSVKSIGTVTNWAGALVSFALIVGVGIWGYKLLVRDVTGIPVVRAVEGPMRVQPEDPGGSTADHQGLAVNSIAAMGTAEPPAARLVLAPRPVALAEEDVATSELMAVAQVLPAPPPVAVPEAASEVVSGAEDEAVAEAAEPAPMATPASMSEMVDQILAQVVQVSASGEDVGGEPAISIPRVEGGIGVSLRPQARPAAMVRQVASLGPATAAGAPVPDVDPDSIAAGTRLVQLGAYDSPEVAKREWDRLAGRFGDYLQGKSRVIQLAESGGRSFYRLRAMGFADINDARRFCSALVAERADCIPVVAK